MSKSNKESKFVPNHGQKCSVTRSFPPAFVRWVAGEAAAHHKTEARIMELAFAKWLEHVEQMSETEKLKAYADAEKLLDAKYKGLNKPHGPTD